MGLFNMENLVFGPVQDPALRGLEFDSFAGKDCELLCSAEANQLRISECGLRTWN